MKNQIIFSIVTALTLCAPASAHEADLSPPPVVGSALQIADDAKILEVMKNYERTESFSTDVESFCCANLEVRADFISMSYREPGAPRPSNLLILDQRVYDLGQFSLRQIRKVAANRFEVEGAFHRIYGQNDNCRYEWLVRTLRIELNNSGGTYLASRDRRECVPNQR